MWCVQSNPGRKCFVEESSRLCCCLRLQQQVTDTLFWNFLFTIRLDLVLYTWLYCVTFATIIITCFNITLAYVIAMVTQQNKVVVVSFCFFALFLVTNKCITRNFCANRFVYGYHDSVAVNFFCSRVIKNKIVNWILMFAFTCSVWY